MWSEKSTFFFPLFILSSGRNSYSIPKVRRNLQREPLLIIKSDFLHNMGHGTSFDQLAFEVDFFFQSSPNLNIAKWLGANHSSYWAFPVLINLTIKLRLGIADFNLAPCFTHSSSLHFVSSIEVSIVRDCFQCRCLMLWWCLHTVPSD